MAERAFTIVGGEEPYIELEAEAGLDFIPFVVPIPQPLTGEGLDAFRNECTEVAQANCGNVACVGSVVFSSAQQLGTRDRLIIGAKIVCDNRKNCPIDRGDGGGTREPVGSPPPSPPLQAHSELEAV